MEITQETKLSDILETETCGRCGGSGRYSYNQIHGSMCYGCQGKGVRLTKRGAAASALHRHLVSTEARYVREGDRLFESGPMTVPGWSRVVEVGPEDKQGRILYRTGKVTHHDFPTSSVVLGGLDPLVRLGILKTVAEYQESLTKQGKPRKDSRFAPVAA